MSTDQEYWDACLIKTWRKHATMSEAFSMFTSITGKRSDEAGILRVPKGKYPIAVRVFVAGYLPKISDWLHKCGPEHDVTLLKKLSNSNYDVKLLSVTLPDMEKKELYKQQYRDNQRIKLNVHLYETRNSDTDWKTVGGSSRRKAR